MTNADTQTVRVLGLKDLEDMIDLQDAVLATLPADQDILHVKTHDDYAAILSDPNKCVIGINTEYGLGGMSVIIEPSTNNPDADILDFPLRDAPETISTLSAVMVRPDLRGRNVMMALQDFWQDRANGQNRSHLHAIVTRSNTPSWNNFLKSGLRVVDAGYDPSDGSTVYLMHKNISTPDCHKCLSNTAEFNACAARILVTPETPLITVRHYFQDGHTGLLAERSPADNRPTGSLYLFAPETLKCRCP